jgi:mRNA-degrading endonuclease RelE of RelBE toxin-antitoxin system
MSASEIIEEIKKLSADEQARIAEFIAENGDLAAPRKFYVDTEDDGLPVIRANGGNITSQLVREIESRTP